MIKYFLVVVDMQNDFIERSEHPGRARSFRMRSKRSRGSTEIFLSHWIRTVPIILTPPREESSPSSIA